MRLYAVAINHRLIPVHIQQRSSKQSLVYKVLQEGNKLPEELEVSCGVLPLHDHAGIVCERVAYVWETLPLTGALLE